MNDDDDFGLLGTSLADLDAEIKKLEAVTKLDQFNKQSQQNNNIKQELYSICNKEKHQIECFNDLNTNNYGKEGFGYAQIK